MGDIVRLSAVIFKAGDVWHGQCLEHDIAARAKTPQDILHELERAIVAHVAIANENGLGALKSIPSAPDVYRTMFNRGLKVEPPEMHTFVIEGRRLQPVADLRLSETLEPA